jgi:MFS family permease
MTVAKSSFRTVLRVREFRALWLADLQSLLGDQLARVALSVLVFERTGSGFATAATYSLTFLPALFGTPLGVLADRVPRRTLLVAGDLLRAGLLGLMAVPDLPLGVLMVLLFLAVLIGSPWKAAESALVADILAAEGYVLGSGLRLATSQATQLAGFAVGGAVVGAIGSHVALAIDAGTFALSAVVLGIAITPRPAAHAERDGQTGWRVGVSLVMRSRQLRTLLGYAWLAGAFVVPEGLAAPYAAHLGGGARTVGLLLASMPTGTLVSALLFVRLVPRRGRARAVPLLATATGIPLVACAAQPGLALTMLLWAASGALMTYQIQVMTEFVTSAPARFRGQAIAFASSGMLAAQGVGLLLAGACTSFASAPVVIAGAGAVGSALAASLALSQFHSTC